MGGCNRKVYTKTVVQRDTLFQVVTSHDTVMQIGKDSIAYYTIHRIDTVIKTVTVTVKENCETRYQTKFEYKTTRDTVRIREKEETKRNKQDNKTQVKEARIENRNRWWLWLIIGIAIGFLIRTLKK